MKIRIISLSVAAAILAVVMFAGAASPTGVPGPLFASPHGQNEIPNADPDGRGSFSAIIDGDQFCYGLTVTNIDAPIAAHIHAGNAGENGPVVIPLVPPTSGDPGASSACVTADPGLLADILQRPSQYYVNVHTAAFPGGAVRDQLVRHPR